MSYRPAPKISDILNKLKVNELTQLCRKFLLPQHGKKMIIVNRILDYITNVEKEKQIYDFVLHTRPSIFDEIHGMQNTRTNVVAGRNDNTNNPKNDTSPVKKNAQEGVKKKKVRIYQEDHEFASCICGGMHLTIISKACVVKCIECNKSLHVSCFTQTTCVYKDIKHYKILCVLCRLKDMDPFYPVHKALWVKNLGSNSEKISIDAHDLKIWKNQNKEVIMFCIQMDNKRLSTNIPLKQEWPKTLTLKVNGNISEKILAPSWEHKRRDNPLKITHILKAGPNEIDISITNYEQPKFFVLAFVLCNLNTEQSIIENIIFKNTLSFKEAKQRIIHLLSMKHGDDEVMCMEVNRKISLHCPFSLDRILIPCRGVNCSHLQCFDLKSFIDVTKKTKAFNNRWKCPICSLVLRPKDLVVDTFITYVLSEVPQNIKEVELNKNGEFLINNLPFQTNYVEKKNVENKPHDNTVDISHITTKLEKLDNSEELQKSNSMFPVIDEIIILDSDQEDTKPIITHKNNTQETSIHSVLQDVEDIICISDDSDNEPITSDISDKSFNGYK
uniref:GATA zinc finger domain-containing protein 14-like n=1 Tax=Piliocolobus tephrosceles TaxID=591936 RepID=A0A8C9HGE6_9PRIM